MAKQQQQTNRIIRFEDNGQDFLLWEVGHDGTIIRCEPFQYSVWSKWKVVSPSLEAGGYVRIEKKGASMTIKHKIKSVEEIPA